MSIASAGVPDGATRRVVAVNLDPLHAHDLTERQMIREARRAHAGQRANLVEQPRVEFAAARFVAPERLAR